jgi:protoporphyrinogen oxidase
MTAHVLIAGGGIAGLSCGAALARVGLRVAVFEAGERLGGRACSFRDELTGHLVDIGPHVLTSEHRNFLALLERLGTAHEVLWQKDPLITLLDAGRVLRMHAPNWPPPLHGLPNLRNALRCVSLPDLWSNWRVAWHAARTHEGALLGLDAIDALSYLRRMGVSQRFITWFWQSATMALLNVPLAHCSAAALMRVFRLLLGRSGYQFGFPKVALSDLFVPGCVRAIDAAGGSVCVGEQVRFPLVRNGRFAGFQLGGGREVFAEAGVLALPPQALAQMEVPGVDADAWLGRTVEDLRHFAPSPYVSTTLWFDRKLTQERFWARVWRDGDLNTDFYDLSNIRPLPGDAASLVASNAIHAHSAHAMTDAEIVARTVREITEFAPCAAKAGLLHARVHRIPMAIPCPAPGTESRRPSGSCEVPGLRLAGDWTATGLPCSMESAARSGALTAEAVAAALQRTLQIARPVPATQAPVSWLRKS